MEDHADRTGTGCLLLPLPGELVQAAQAHHRAGRLDAAAKLYDRALAADPHNGDALYLVGVLDQQRGEHSRAAGSLERLVLLRPDFAEGHYQLGSTHRALGRLDDAARDFERAVSLAPDHVMAQTSLGVVLVALNRPADALTPCQAAVLLQPDEAVHHSNVANVLRLLRRFDEARAIYEEAIRLNPGLAVAHAYLGLVLAEQNEFDGARRALARAVELEPDRAVFWEHLAELHSLVEQYDAAIPCWERVLALTAKPRSRPHVGLGWALQEEHRGAEAETHFKTAAAIDPCNPQPWLNLGLLYEERGAFDRAESACRTAIRLNSKFAAAHARLATLLRDRLPDADLGALDAQLDDPATSGKPRSQILFARAHVADARGDYGHAARCLREANAIHKECTPAYRRFRPEEHERFIDGLIDAFDAAFFARTAGGGMRTNRPVFIVGLPRSGTTLLEQVLASHPAVRGLGELVLGVRMFATIPRALGSSAAPLKCVPQLKRAMIRRLAHTYEQRLLAIADDPAERLIDKAPDNTLYLGFLLALFPRATVIHCRRNLRDVALSCWMMDFRSIIWASAPEHIAAKFRGHLRIMEHWNATLPATVHEVSYEALVADIEGVSRRVLAAMELEWDPACLEFHRTSRPVRTASVSQVRQPLYTRSIERWRHYETTLADLFETLPPDPPPHTPITRSRAETSHSSTSTPSSIT